MHSILISLRDKQVKPGFTNYQRERQTKIRNSISKRVSISKISEYSKNVKIFLLKKKCKIREFKIMMEYFRWKQLNIYGIARELIPGVAQVNISNR